MDMYDVIRSRRLSLGLSQTELAKTVGVNVRQIARYEAGEQEPGLSVAVSLADALDISLSQLAGQVSDELDLSGAGGRLGRPSRPASLGLMSTLWRSANVENACTLTVKGPVRSRRGATAGEAS